MVQRRTAISLAVGALSVACAAGALTREPEPAPPVEVEQLPEGEASSITGKVINHDDGQPTANALVILECDCLQGSRETQANANGVFAFRDLPPGKYTVHALFGSSEGMRSLSVPRAAKVRVNFALSEQSEVVT